MNLNDILETRVITHQLDGFYKSTEINRRIKQNMHWQINNSFDKVTALNPSHLGIMKDVTTGILTIEKTEDSVFCKSAFTDKSDHQIATLYAKEKNRSSSMSSIFCLKTITCTYCHKVQRSFTTRIVKNSAFL